MRRLNPAVTLTAALLTAAAAASPNPSHAQARGPSGVRPTPTAPEAPAAIASDSPMASARAPRHLLRNGQDYLRYGEYLRALALFREAEARIGELAPAEQRELRDAIEAARRGMRSPEAPAEGLASRRGPSRARPGAMPGAIALAEPSRPGPGPVGSPDGVVLAGAEVPEHAPPAPPEPIAVDPSVLPSAAPPPPEPADLPPIAPEPPPIPLAIPASSMAAQPAPDPAEPDPITLPPLPADVRPSEPSWPTAALGTLPAERPRGPEAVPAPPAELPPLPPSADELMGLGSLGAHPPAPPEASPTPPISPEPSPIAGPSRTATAGASEADPAYRDLLSPEQRREVMMIVRRQQEDAEQRGLMPAPLFDDPLSQGLDRDEMAGTGIQLPRPPSPTEIRPIQSIPVNEAYVPLPPRRFNPSRKYWSAAATCHAPLYFQDPVLERYGQSVEQKLGPIGRFLSYPLDDPTQSRQRNQLAQPFFSAGLFAAQIATWPYKVLMDTPGEAEYDLGYYRPGDLVPPDLFYAPLTGVGPPLRGKHY